MVTWPGITSAGGGCSGYGGGGGSGGVCGKSLGVTCPLLLDSGYKNRKYASS